jgi:hypothetical protein
MNQNFDLRLTGTLAAVSAEVLDSPAGQTSAPSVLPYAVSAEPPTSPRAASAESGAAARAILVNAGPPRPTRDLSLAGQQAIGLALWRCAFGGREVEGLWRASVAATGPEGVLRLRLAVDAPELAALPWELLYDLTTTRFLALDAHTPVTRFVRLPIPAIPWPQGRALHLLFTGASPAGWPRLEVAKEWSGIAEVIAPALHAGRLAALPPLPEGATLSALLAALRRTVDLWHFAGHGYEQGLAFVTAAGQEHRVEAGMLGQMLAGEGVRLAVLNACRAGAGGGQAASVAGALVRAGLPAVVAMQTEIYDDAALAFAGAFYDAIALGHGVDRSLTAARKAIWATGRAEWWAPALYMRTPEAQLWQVPAAAQAPQITVHGGVIQATGPVAIHGSAVSTGSGVAVAGGGVTNIGGVQTIPRPPGRPPGWDDTLTALRDVLAALYPSDDDARRIAAEAGLSTRRVKFGNQSVLTWHSLLHEASLQDMMPAILEVVCSPNEFQRNAALAEAASAYLARNPG